MEIIFHFDEEGTLIVDKTGLEEIQKFVTKAEDFLIRDFLTNSPHIIYPTKEQWLKEQRLKKHRRK